MLGALGLLRELDHDRIPNLGLVDSPFLDLDYDSKNRWSAPARYGVYGFGYRHGVVNGKALAWSDFFDLVLTEMLVYHRRFDDRRGAYRYSNRARLEHAVTL